MDADKTVTSYRLAVRRFVASHFGPDGEGTIPASKLADFLDSLEPNSTKATDADIVERLHRIAEDMNAAIRDHEKYGYGVIVDYQLGKIGRENVSDDPVTIRTAADTIERLRKENADYCQAFSEIAGPEGDYLAVRRGEIERLRAAMSEAITVIEGPGDEDQKEGIRG